MKSKPLIVAFLAGCLPTTLSCTSWANNDAPWPRAMPTSEGSALVEIEEPASFVLQVGEVLKLEMLPNVRWEIDPWSKGAVNLGRDGLVTGMIPGPVRLKALADSEIASLTIAVVPSPPQGRLLLDLGGIAVPSVKATNGVAVINREEELVNFWRTKLGSTNAMEEPEVDFLNRSVVILRWADADPPPVLTHFVSDSTPVFYLAQPMLYRHGTVSHDSTTNTYYIYETVKIPDDTRISAYGEVFVPILD